MPLSRLAELYGVAPSYAPAPDRTVRATDAALVAVLAALDVDAGTPAAARDALAARERELRARLLPPTVVWWRGGPPAALAGLPAGTRLEVGTEQGGAHTWTTPRHTVGIGPDRPDAEPSLPYGVHTLTAAAPDGRTARAHLVVAPERMPDPVAPREPVSGERTGSAGGPAGRVHGLLVQLYSLLSTRSWGMGDLADLAELASWSCRTFGTGFVQVNPLHSGMPGELADPSPYRPSSRYVPDPVHLRVEHVPEYAYLPAEARAEADDLRARAGRLRAAVLDGGPVDRTAVHTLKHRALELVGQVPLGPGRHAAYVDFLGGAGTALEDHATWCALAEVHGPDWRRWPAGLREPRSAATARARRDLLDRVDLHSRLAWYVDEQLAAAQSAARAAGMPVGIVHDLAVGVHPSGSDAWAQQEYLANGVSLGAPPDAFTPHGQDWALPPWRPDRLAAAGYAPYRRLLRSLFRHAGGLRIDHVAGLFRLWWIPSGREPDDGVYVHYDSEAVLAVLALEAHRAGALVIGEDLGTVAPSVRGTLRDRGVLGTSVLWFERAAHGAAAGTSGDRAPLPPPLPPERWRPDCLATLTTHDLPPTAARLTGDDVALRHRLGLLTGPLDEERGAAAAETAEWLETLARLGLLHEEEGGGEAPAVGRHPPLAVAETFRYAGEEERIRALYRFLLRTPARLVGVWLPDAVGDRRPQNVPGTWREYPNWRLPVADPEGRPLTLEGLAASPRLHALMAVVRGTA